MIRVASLTLPFLSIERVRRLEKTAGRPERAALATEPAPQPPAPIDDNPGACSVPRGGGWRPGARWARDAAADDLPAHQRPTLREMGRRSEPADHPFHAMPADEGARAVAMVAPPVVPAFHLGLDRPNWHRPMVLIQRSGQREVITAACPLALQLGLHPGMVAAHARALVSDLDIREAEPEADKAWLERLALHALSHWTPTVAVSGDDGLWFDLTGTTHLFGGEARFCRRLLRFLARLGYTASIAVAGTPGAAHALARYSGQRVTLLPNGEEARALADLPLAALRLEPEALAAAARFGLERIGDLYPMPRGPLARRLGLSTVTRLDQARGMVAEPIVPVSAFEMPSARRSLLEPIGTAEAIAQVIGDLVEDLVEQLQQRRLGLRAAHLTCRIVDGSEQRVAIGTARATRDARHLTRMLVARIERIDPGLGIETMLLTAPHVEDLQASMVVARLGRDDHTPDLALLVDQLSGRVPGEAIFRLSSHESDVPERAIRRIEPLGTATGWPEWVRRVRLLSRPEALSSVVALLPDHPPRRFVWRGSTYRVVAGDGPERVHGEWWRRPGEMWAVRDYFRVETEGGARFWLFRRGDGVEDSTGDLSWHMHGFFG